MAGILDAISRALKNAVETASKNIGSNTSSNKSSNKSKNVSSNYSNNYGYDSNTNTWGLNNPNQTYEQQQVAQQDYYKTPTGQAELNKINQQKEHKDYIENNGGFDNYYKLQQQKYNDALAKGDKVMLANLEADAQRVGYTLVPTTTSNGTNYGGDTNINTVPTVQQSSLDFEQQIKQMQEYYAKQMEDFQNQLKAQEESKLQLDADNKLKTQQQNNYQYQNQQNINKSTSGVIGGVGYQPQQVRQGAHIKINSNGQPGAISRYLAQDIWKNK